MFIANNNLEANMYSVETSVVMAVIMISILLFLNFSFNLERKVYKNINESNDSIRKEYSIEGEKKFIPEKIQRIIKNIDYLKED